MAEFDLTPMPEPMDCHVKGGKSKLARTRVHFAEQQDVTWSDHDWEGRTLCGQVGRLTDVGYATGPRCQSCVKAKGSAARVKRVAR